VNLTNLAGLNGNSLTNLQSTNITGTNFTLASGNNASALNWVGTGNGNGGYLSLANSTGLYVNRVFSGNGQDLLIGEGDVGDSIIFQSGGGLTNSAKITPTGFFGLATNAFKPVPSAGYGYFWPSNYNLYWVTPTKTNLIVLGQ
jgi:hypothetical protein